MNFDKIINNMQELQSKIEVYEQKNKKIEDAISSINKEILKLEKKKSVLKDEIDKHILDIKIITMKDIINKFNTKD
jgi:predicted  nucleic acid-binding Zn-ribbon protein